MWKYLRYTFISLTFAVLCFSVTGCHNNSQEVVSMVDLQVSDFRIPKFTSSEAARYGLSSDLIATDKTWETLNKLDIWPDKIRDFVFLLPASQIPDEVYEKWAKIYLSDLDYTQMADFLELFFDTYEYKKDSETFLLKINDEKLNKMQHSMEQLLKKDNYDNHDMLHKYCLFVSAKFVPAIVIKNQTSFQAFSIVENSDSHYYNYSKKEYTFVLNSLVLNYLGVNETDMSEISQNVTVFKTAMDTHQLTQQNSFFWNIGLEQIENALKADNSRLVEELKRQYTYEGSFCSMCVDFGYAYTKIIFSDTSIGPVRMVFPRKSTANVFNCGEESIRDEANDTDEGILITAE